MNRLKKIGVLAVACVMGLCCLAQNADRKHEVQMGETLYSIGRSYGVSVEAIRKANSQMGETLLAGTTIVIPGVASAASTTAATVPATAVTPASTGNTQGGSPCKLMYMVEKKETIYSISRKFGLTEDELRRANPQVKKDKVKKGEYLCIPYSATELARQRQLEAQRQQEQQAKAEEALRQAKLFQKISVAVILPFGLDAEKKTNEAVKMVDFYEGFLLAVDELKAKGISVDIYAYEEKGGEDANISTILRKNIMPHVNLIVGPMRQENIPAVSQFAKQHHIPLCIPFTSRPSVLVSAPTVFQVNTQVSTLYASVYDQFVARHGNTANIVFVNCADKSDRPDYLSGFRQALSQKSIGHKTVELSELAKLSEVTTTDRKTILIPSTSSQSAFETMVRRLNQNADLAAYDLALFGFPEWQTFNEKNKQNLRKFHASFFATFYTNTASSGVQAFNRQFSQWFKRDQFNSYPLYGLLGYDIARYFITGLHTYGTDFVQKQDLISVPALQNPMRFEQRNPDNGFINTYVRIINL